MTYLLDTHVWLWLQVEPERVRRELLDDFADPDTVLLLSSASSWEISIKYALGKLALPEVPAVYVPDRLSSGGVASLAVEHQHALAVAELPHHHGDPFDRMLVVQARAEGLRLVSADNSFDAYDVDLVHAVHDR